MHAISEPTLEPVATSDAVTDFISRWQDKGGTEKANYQLFLTELCTLLDLPQPDPASDDTQENGYTFERRVHIHRSDGTSTHGFIDLYRRGSFVLEAKQTGKTLNTQGWDKAMLRAQAQADKYVRALPADEGRPPFIVVTDVGRSLELYAEFTRTGGTYVPYPDPGHHRIRLEDLHQPHIQHRLKNLWTDPDALDTSKQAARVTRDVSRKLAELAKSLEQGNHPVEQVAHFLKRCLFTMFSEDVNLIPYGSFTTLLEKLQSVPEHFPDAMRSLWETMNNGGYEGQLMKRLPRFNGGLFKEIDPIALNADQISLLVEAARADWRFVEPAIFGTLLERALDPRERHKLGAHYTPRAYVERLVIPTLIDPLRQEWQIVQVAAEAWLQQEKRDKALKELRSYHHKLCHTRVLDPACGSGNFLYVALEHLKRLEGEVLNLIRDLSAGQASFDTAGLTVDPHQFLGIEINPRAAAIAEIVLWIGYLQWHYRINGKLDLPEPILKDFHNIECRDALITYDAREPILDDKGQPLTIWDGISYKKSPITGDLIPDDQQRIPVHRFINPKKAEWPEADYIVGNPPFIGAKRMRDLLGDGYVDAVQNAWPDVPQSTDFVMRWWHKAAQAVKNGNAVRFGFITTKSINQTYIRRAVEPHLEGKNSIDFAFAIPNHPWVDDDSGAAVRIAMTVCAKRVTNPKLVTVISENGDGEDLVSEVRESSGKISASLKIGADVSSSLLLSSNRSLCSVGMKTIGASFQIDADKAKKIGFGLAPGLEKHIKPYFGGRDFTGLPRGVYVIDFYEVPIEELQSKYPDAYQYLLNTAKPERDKNKNKIFREKWWVIGHPRQDFRSFSKDIDRYIVTVETMKHRVFGFVHSGVNPDSTLVTFGLQENVSLGILSSRIHCSWALASGGRLGVGNDPRYNKTRCFETFPFPDIATADKFSGPTNNSGKGKGSTTADEHLIERIGRAAEDIDNHRKRQQAAHNRLTLTGMYNVLEKLREEEPLNVKEKQIHEWGLVSVLRELHDELDRAVFDAYGWSDLGDVLVGRPGATTPLPDKPTEQAEAEEELLCRLVDLNRQRAAEEAQGQVRWLRPDYQAPDATQTSARVTTDQTEEKKGSDIQKGKATWPKQLSQQVEVVRELLAIGPQTIDTLASHFKRKPGKGVSQVLAALEVLGQASRQGDLWELVAG
jgi:hypothetical protein